VKRLSDVVNGIKRLLTCKKEIPITDGDMVIELDGHPDNEVIYSGTSPAYLRCVGGVGYVDFAASKGDVSVIVECAGSRVELFIDDAHIIASILPRLSTDEDSVEYIVNAEEGTFDWLKGTCTDYKKLYADEKAELKKAIIDLDDVRSMRSTMISRMQATSNTLTTTKAKLREARVELDRVKGDLGVICSKRDEYLSDSRSNSNELRGVKSTLNKKGKELAVCKQEKLDLQQELEDLKLRHNLLAEELDCVHKKSPESVYKKDNASLKRELLDSRLQCNELIGQVQSMTAIIDLMSDTSKKTVQNQLDECFVCVKNNNTHKGVSVGLVRAYIVLDAVVVKCIGYTEKALGTMKGTLKRYKKRADTQNMTSHEVKIIRQKHMLKKLHEIRVSFKQVLEKEQGYNKVVGDLLTPDEDLVNKKDVFIETQNCLGGGVFGKDFDVLGVPCEKCTKWTPCGDDYESKWQKTEGNEEVT